MAFRIHVPTSRAVRTLATPAKTLDKLAEGAAMTDDMPTTQTPFRRLRGRYDRYTRERLEQVSRRLKRMIYPERAAVEAIEIAGPTDRIGYAAAQSLTYRPIGLGEPLGPLWATYWVRVTARVPEAWRGARVDLHWDSASEALLRLDGRTAQGLNIGRTTARLVERAVGGETVTFDLEVACNRALGSAEDGIPHTTPYRLTACELRRFDPEAFALYYDFEVLRQLEADREPPQAPRSYGGVAPRILRPALDTTWSGRLKHRLNDVCNSLDPEDRATWPAARAVLTDLLSVRNGGVVHELSAIGHAHLDTAWLWPIEETWRKCQRSFANVLALMDEYPEFKFACSQACQYAVIEEMDPGLFARIKEKVANGQWISIGGSWVEPDCNLPSGESICRQFLYGQRYFESRFGARAQVFWNPDVFGYAGQLPQLMREAGMDRFLTQKLSWNRFTSPLHHSFHWRGLDGSSVLTHFPPVDTYNAVATVEELRYHAANYKDADRTTEALYLFGHGDGGGGPNPEMVEYLRRTNDLLGVPRCETRGPDAFFDRLAADADQLATVEGELYFEYHRGTYTSQAEIKRLNRLVEGRLQDLEFVATVCGLTDRPAPTRDAVEALWRVLLVNQFHDILPGSSIAEVYDRARPQMAELAQAVADETAACVKALSPTPGDGWRPINAMGFPRAGVAEAPDGALHFVTAPPFAAGVIAEARDAVTLTEVPGGDIRLQNAQLIAILTPEGAVRSLVHRATGREALAEPANRFVLYDDRPTAFEAWDIDPFALETGVETAGAHAREVLLRGPLRAAVRFERKIGKASTITQTIRLDAASGRLDFDTTIDWRERRTLLKVAFPLACAAQRATYETMFGAVERPTHANTDADMAQYEVPGHRWADLSDPAFGVSLLSDARYGYSTFGGVMTLSLLRGTQSPDRHADVGVHQLSYALYPHAGDWRDASTVAEALRFNRPLLWTDGAPGAALATSIVTADTANVVIDTIKPAEDGDGWVLRLYESHGAATTARLGFEVPVSAVCLSNTLEDRLQPLALDGAAVVIPLRPFQIVTLRIT
jgi:alpha-mannosidase